MALTIRFTPGRVLAVGDLITEDILNDLANPTVELEGTVNTSTIGDASITLAKLIVGILTADSAGRSRMADGFVTDAKLDATQNWTGKTISGNPSVTLTGVVNLSGATVTMPAGAVVQQVHASTAVFSTLTSAGVGTGDLSGATSGAIPLDDTIPQSSEGAQLFTATITPKSATNILELDVLIPVTNGVAGTQVVALFQDATAGALAATDVTLSAGFAGALVLRHRMVAGTTSATTFKVRVGCNNGTLTINGASGARVFGGVSAARFVIHELTA